MSAHYAAVNELCLTGKRTTGTVRVTATSTASLTQRIRVSRGSTRLYVWSSSGSVFPVTQAALTTRLTQR